LYGRGGKEEMREEGWMMEQKKGRKRGMRVEG
jgi:hypothetical protein